MTIHGQFRWECERQREGAYLVTELAVPLGVPLADGLRGAGNGEIVGEGTSFPGGAAPLAMEFTRHMAQIFRYT